MVSSGGFTAAYKILAPLYAQASGVKIVSEYGASIGNAPDSIPSRLARGEKFDIVILADSAFEKLVAEGKGVAGSRVDLGRSLIGASVKKGTPKPDISTVPALKNALLNAKSVAYSASASGTYLSEELFAKLGEEPFEQAVDVLADVLNGRHCQLAFTAWEMVVEAAFGRAGNF